MLNKKKQKNRRPQGHFDTLVSAKTTVEGNIRFSGGLHIDGKVCGDVVADEEAGSAVIRLSECGEVLGNIVAPYIVINGNVEGDVFALAHLELAEKAAIKGNVYYNLVEMAAGASVNGSMVHSKDPETLPKPARLSSPVPARSGDELPENSSGEPGAMAMDSPRAANGKDNS